MTQDNLPSPWILRFSSLIPEKGKVLDVACGTGRHTRWFLERGCQLTAIDKDLSRMNCASENLNLIQVNLEDGSPWPLRGYLFDAVIVTNYLWRPLFPHLLESLNEDGILLYETFMQGNETYGHPRNPAFLLNASELLQQFSPPCQVISFEQGYVEEPAPKVIQRICAQNGTSIKLLNSNT